MATASPSSLSTDGEQDAALSRRCIYNEKDLQAFLVSPTKEALLKFTTAMGQSCASNELLVTTSTSTSTSTSFTSSTTSSTTTSSDIALVAALSPGLATWLGALEGMQAWLTEIPPQLGEVRFGNPAFKRWHGRLVQRAPHIFQTILRITKEQELVTAGDYDLELLMACRKQGNEAASSDNEEDFQEEDDATATATTKKLVHELCAYIHDAFGHPVRLDYGTGHESSFQITLYALFQCNVFGNDFANAEAPTKRRLKAATLSLYKAYLTTTRGLQKDYRLEPAGSHGVWGLDDYYCLSFYFGAQQLAALGDASKPSDIYQKSKDETDQYLYYSCIAFIQELKSRAPFYETSPMLHDISALPSWSKVAAGLWKLYQGEVLSKLPVVQHWVFGPLLFPANTWTPSQRNPPTAPTQTFRPLYANRAAAVPTGMPPTKAPWAK